jgi:hypothetical protein
MLLAPFRVEMLTASHAAPLAQLATHYGEPWAHDLITAWSGGDRSRPSPWNQNQDRRAWIESLPALCEGLSAVPGAGTSTARHLMAISWTWLRDSVSQYLRLTSPSHRDRVLGELGPAIAALLASTAVTEAADLRDEVVKFLRQDDDNLVACLMPALRAATALSPDTRRAPGLDIVAEHCAKLLEARLARPQRADGDWSVKLPDGCTCDLCGTLGEFLGDPVRRSFEWPLAEQRRRHVHSRIDAAELPVRHQTRRTGRPYTLVLAKTEELFEREREARRQAQADLTWLNRSTARR